jgi:glutamate--cysteine ligase
VETIHDTCKEVGSHLREVRAVADELQLGFLGMGFQPKWRRDEMPWMPKGRYRIMRDVHAQGRQPGPGHDDPHLHGAGQPGLRLEADMVKKFRVSLALQPVATALFADSPFTEGKPNGQLSYRSHIWTDTDPDRTGMLDFVFEDGFGYERYVDYLLDVPMYFSYRDGEYIDASGKSFRTFLRGELDVLPGRVADHPRLERPHDHRLPGSAAEEIPGDARRRWRAVEPPVRAAGVLGRPAVRRCRAGCGMGPGQGFLDGRAQRVARWRADACAEDCRSATARCATSPSRP